MAGPLSSARRSVPRRVTAARDLGVSSWAALFAGLALLVRLPLFFGPHQPPRGGDSAFYMLLGHGLLHGQGLQGQHFYAPGYPVFDAAMELLPGRTADAATVVQHLVAVAVVVVMLVATWRYFGRAPALLAATVGALCPIFIAHEHQLLPDFLFGALVLVGALALAEACRRRPVSWRLLAAAGIVFGLATWLKPAGQFLFVAAVPALLFATRDVRRTLKGSAVVALALLAIISPWLARNWHRFGYPSMSNQGGQTLFNRVFEEDKLPIPTDAKWGAFAQQIKLRIERDPSRSRAPNGYPRLHYDVHEALVLERGLSSDAAIEVEQRLALVAIRRHPIEYLRGTGRQLGKLIGDLHSFQGAGEARAKLDSLGSFATPAWDLARGAYGVWWLLSLSAAGGLLTLFVGRRDQRDAAAALISVWFAVALGTVMAHGAAWRYSVQLAPLTWIVGSAGIVILVSSVWTCIRRGSPDAA